AKDSYAMNVDGGFEPLMRVGIAGVHGGSGHKTTGVSFRNINHIPQGNADASRIESRKVRCVHLAFRHLPAQQPSTLDAGRIHVLDDSGAVVADPARVT